MASPVSVIFPLTIFDSLSEIAFPNINTSSDEYFSHLKLYSTHSTRLAHMFCGRNRQCLRMNMTFKDEIYTIHSAQIVRVEK